MASLSEIKTLNGNLPRNWVESKNTKNKQILDGSYQWPGYLTKKTDKNKNADWNNEFCPDYKV